MRLALALAALPALAQAVEPESCWRRVYTEDHLAAQPAQTVRWIEVAFDAFPGEDDNREAFVRVQFRDAPEVLRAYLFCYRSAAERGMPADLPPGAFSCYVECDGGAFHAWRRDARTLLLRSEGFVVAGGCREPGEDALPQFRRVIDEGDAATLYRLNRVDPASCPRPAPGE